MLGEGNSIERRHRLTLATGGDKGNLRLRGKSAIGTSTLNASSYFILGNNELPTACTGNILTLVDYENYESGTLDTSNTRFRQKKYQVILYQ